MNKIILVTGGTGFIGANLVRFLINNGDRVNILVRKGGSLWRIQDIRDKVIIHESPLLDYKMLSTLLKKISPQWIFHLATYGSYPSQQDLKQMLEVNTDGTANLLLSTLNIPYESLVVTGSSSEYGKKDKPMNEYDYLDPNNFYAATKASQTHLCTTFSSVHHKPVAILRLFSVYGAFEEKGRLVRSVIESAIQNKPILLSTGKEARDFIYVEDVVDALISTAKLTHKRKGEIINIGSGTQYTTKDLVEMVTKLSNSKSRIILGAYPGRPWDVTKWVADTGKATSLLNWKPRYNLEEGLKKTIAWYRNQ